MYCKWLNSFIWLIDVTIIGTTTLAQSWISSNSNEGVLHIPQNQNLTIRWFSVISRTLLGGGVLPLCWDAVGIFYSGIHLRQDFHNLWDRFHLFLMLATTITTIVIHFSYSRQVSISLHLVCSSIVILVINSHKVNTFNSYQCYVWGFL